MTPYQTQCVYDALQYSRNVEARKLGYPDYAELYFLFHHCKAADYLRTKADFEKVVLIAEPLFMLWLNEGDV